MDPEVVFLGAVLAVLGARRRAAQGDGPTAGERLEQRALDSSNRVGGVASGIVQIPSGITAETIAKASAVPGSGLLAGAIATGGRLGASLIQAGLSATTQVVSRPAGLVVDGGVAVADFAVPLLRRSRPEDHKASPAKRTSAKKHA